MANIIIDDLAESLRQFFGGEDDIDGFLYLASRGLAENGVYTDGYNGLPWSHYEQIWENDLSNSIPHDCN